LDKPVKKTVLTVIDADAKGQMTRQRVRGAAETRIISTKGHFDAVEQTVIDLAFLDQAFGGFIDAHGDSGAIVLRRHDEVGFGQQTLSIGFKMVEKRAPRCLDHANAYRGRGGRESSQVSACDFGVMG